MDLSAILKLFVSFMVTVLNTVKTLQDFTYLELYIIICMSM